MRVGLKWPGMDEAHSRPAAFGETRRSEKTSPRSPSALSVPAALQRGELMVLCVAGGRPGLHDDAGPSLSFLLTGGNKTLLICLVSGASRRGCRPEYWFHLRNKDDEIWLSNPNPALVFIPPG